MCIRDRIGGIYYGYLEQLGYPCFFQGAFRSGTCEDVYKRQMSELPSALFSIADGNEFRFARFYIVCEEVALAPLKSPLIVCGLPDTPVDCQSVAKTRNLMPDAARKKYSHFALKNTSRSCIRNLFRSFVLHTTVRDHVSPTTAVRRLPLLRAADTAAALPLLLRAP